MTLKARTVVPLALAVTAVMSLVAANVAQATHPRPVSATKLTLSMVPAFNQCTTPNRTHGPPLAAPSCNPPVQVSDSVTIGSQSLGNIKIAVLTGAPGPPEDSDVKLVASSTDIRCTGATLPAACGSTNASGGADYIGELEGNATIRITDHWNSVAAGGGPDPATVTDLPFPVVATCASTASTSVGGTCGVNTSANAVVPAVVKDGKRAVVEIGQVQVIDGGTDGQVATVPNELFSVQGIFIP